MLPASCLCATVTKMCPCGGLRTRSNTRRRRSTSGSTRAGSIRCGKIMEQPGDPVERLKRGLIAYIEFGLANPHHYRATFMMPFPEGFDHEKYHQEDSPGMQAFAFLTRGLTECIKAGKLPAMNVELASQTLWAGIHGITSLLITHYTFPWAGRDKVIHSTVDTLVAGLAG